MTSRTAQWQDAIRPPARTEVRLRGAAGIALCPLEAGVVAGGYLRADAGGPAAAARRGLYVHVSHRMRQELTAALQARWEEALRARAAISQHSPVPLVNELLAPYRHEPGTPVTHLHAQAGKPKKMISQISPKSPEDLMRQVG